jgi:hypothetical protein
LIHKRSVAVRSKYPEVEVTASAAASASDAAAAAAAAADEPRLAATKSLEGAIVE